MAFLDPGGGAYGWGWVVAKQVHRWVSWEIAGCFARARGLPCLHGVMVVVWGK